MSVKKIVGVVLMTLAILTFFLYLLYPFLGLDSNKTILITVSLYVLNKIFFYSAIYLLGKEFIVCCGRYLPVRMERLLLKIIKVKPVTVIDK